jgi:putative pyoverdin transport system ATP-binding/permease protein
MRVIRWLLTESIFRFILASLASIAGGLLTVGVLVLLFRVISKDAEVRLELFVLLSVGAVACRTLARRLIGSIGRDAILFLRVELFRRTIAAPLADIERIGRSRLVMALTDDIGRIASIVPSLVILCTNVTLIIACLAYLGWLSIVQLGITLLVVAAGLICHVVLRREGTKQTRISREKRHDLLEVFRSSLDGVKELKLNSGRRRQALQEFSERARELQASVQRQALFFGGSATAAQVLFYVALGLVMFDFAGATNNMQLVASYGIAIVYLMAPLQGSIQIFQGLVAADIAFERVEELGIMLALARAKDLDPESNERDAATRVAALPFDKFRKLDLRAITHSYGADVEGGSPEFVLGPVDLTLCSGEILFVVGGNGSGKTTLAKIMAGLYRADSGSILVNDHEVTAADTEWYCQLFSAIFHDFFVFDRLPDGEQWPEDLLRRFEIEGRVQLENSRILKPSELSVGERKRLALMFAYLENKPIVVFDEWAADQDPGFKEMFYKEFLQELRARGKLVIVISHDDRYFQFGDKLLVLERGKPPLQREIGPGRGWGDAMNVVNG